MDNNKTVGIKNYFHLIQKINAVFNLSLREIKKRYIHVPICLMKYLEKGEKEELIEIRFDREEITMSCTFDSDGMCNCVSLFPDTDEVIQRFIRFLKETHEYDYIKNQWIGSNYFILTKKVARSVDDICFMFYSSQN